MDQIYPTLSIQDLLSAPWMPWCLPCAVDWNAVDVVRGDEDKPRVVVSSLGGRGRSGDGDDDGGAESLLTTMDSERTFAAAVAAAVAVVVVGAAASGIVLFGDETLGALAAVAIVAGTFVVAPTVFAAVWVDVGFGRLCGKVYPCYGDWNMMISAQDVSHACQLTLRLSLEQDG